MDGSKPWYQSLTIWSLVGSGMLGIYTHLLQNGAHIPEIPAWVITALSFLGIYNRYTAKKKLTP